MKFCFNIPGAVLACNKKAKQPNERISAIYNAHFGPVYALQRNPCFPKNFLTVGDWCARIWSEDIKESSIMWTRFAFVNLLRSIWTHIRVAFQGLNVKALGNRLSKYVNLINESHHIQHNPTSLNFPAHQFLAPTRKT